jgi:hypothetical protein
VTSQVKSTLELRDSRLYLSTGYNQSTNLSLKLISPSAAPIIHEHLHPQNSLTVTPFSIINGKYIKDK